MLIKLWSDFQIKIGSTTTANFLESWLEDCASVVICDDCMVSHEVLMLADDMHGIFDIAERHQINAERSCIEIGRHVWLVRRTALTKSGRVGHGYIVATNAIVTKSFGENFAIGGNPARVIRQGVY